MAYENESAWLNCQVFPGLFSNEFAVRVEILTGKNYENRNVAEIFVDETLVDVARDRVSDEGAPGKLKVYRGREMGGGLIVKLPGDSIMFGSVVAVPADHVAHSR